MVDEEIIPQKKSISEDHNDEPVSLMSDLTDQVFSARKNRIIQYLKNQSTPQLERLNLSVSDEAELLDDKLTDNETTADTPQEKIFELHHIRANQSYNTLSEEKFCLLDSINKLQLAL